MSSKLTNQSAVSSTAAVLTTVFAAIFATSPQPAFAKNDPNASSQNAETQSQQHKNSTHQDVTERLQYLTDKLNLTEEQKKALLLILEDRIDEIHRLNHDESLSTDQSQLNLMTVRKKTKQRIIKILTPDQQTIFLQLKEEFLDDFNSHVKARLDLLSKELKTTEDQKKALRTILLKEAEETHNVRYDDSLTIEQQYRIVKTVHQETKEQINNLLTPQQQAIFAQLKDKIPKATLEGVTRRIKKLTEGLDLTDEQTKAVMAIVEKELEDIKAAKDDNSLTAKLRLSKIKAIHQQTSEQISKLLTPDQQAKFEQIKNKAAEQKK